MFDDHGTLYHFNCPNRESGKPIPELVEVDAIIRPKDFHESKEEIQDMKAGLKSDDIEVSVHECPLCKIQIAVEQFC